MLTRGGASKDEFNRPKGDGKGSLGRGNSMPRKQPLRVWCGPCRWGGRGVGLEGWQGPQMPARKQDFIWGVCP